MPKYVYTVKTGEGRSIQGFINAKHEGEVNEALKQKGLMVISIERAKKVPIKKARKKVGIDDMVIFTRQMATMIMCSGTGPPCTSPGLTRTLSRFKKQLKGYAFRKMGLPLAILGLPS